MTRDEIEAIISRPRWGKRFRITFSDGAIQDVDVRCVDDEGVLHSGPDGIEPDGWWARFEAIRAIEVIGE
jgi:hypothetical protein